jgi:type III secretory pathway component EscV
MENLIVTINDWYGGGYCNNGGWYNYAYGQSTTMDPSTASALLFIGILMIFGPYIIIYIIIMLMSWSEARDKAKEKEKQVKQAIIDTQKDVKQIKHEIEDIKKILRQKPVFNELPSKENKELEKTLPLMKRSSETERKYLFCPECGNKLPPEVIFCPACGKKL